MVADWNVGVWCAGEESAMVGKKESTDAVLDQSSGTAADDDDDDDDATNERMMLDVITSPPLRQDAFCQTTTTTLHDEWLPAREGKGSVAVNGAYPMTQLRSVTCHMGSYSVTCYPTQVNTPRLNPSQTGQLPVLDLPTPEGWKAELT